MPYLFTSESVSEGHPDKVADQISDALIDHFLAFDPQSKVACETLVTTGQVVLAGEVKSNAYLDVQQADLEVAGQSLAQAEAVVAGQRVIAFFKEATSSIIVLFKKIRSIIVLATLSVVVLFLYQNHYPKSQRVIAMLISLLPSPASYLN